MPEDPESRLSVLFLDDQEGFLDIMATRLKAEGFRRVHTAQTCADGTAVLAKEEIDVVVCDWKLMGEDGIDWLMRQGLGGREVRLVLLTGFLGSISAQKLAASRTRGIEIVNKADITATEDLVRIVIGGEERPTRRARPGVSYEHLLAEQALQLDELQHYRARSSEARDIMLRHFMSGLDAIAVSEDTRLVGGGGPATKNEIRSAIDNMTEEGVQMVNLYFSVVERVLSGKRGR